MFYITIPNYYNAAITRHYIKEGITSCDKLDITLSY